MMTVTYSLIVLALVPLGASIPSYDFTNFCIGKPIAIPSNSDQMLLTYHRSIHLRPNKTCIVTVYNPSLSSESSVIADFYTFRVDNSPGCVYSRMDIYDDMGTNPSKALTGPNGLCGSDVNFPMYYNSSGQYMTFKFQDENVGSNFQIILTSAHTGNCYGSEFSCGNGYCVKHELTCNGYNNCGNDTDELVCAVVLAAGTIVLIVFGSLLFVICTPLIIVCLICRNRRPQRLVYSKI